MTDEIFKQTERVRGNFVSFVKYRLYKGTEKDSKGPKTELKVVSKGKYLKSITVEIPVYQSILNMLGITKRVFTFVEEITLGPNNYTSIIRAPEELKGAIDFVEKLEFSQKGSDIEYSLLVTGKSNLTAPIAAMVERIYTSNRIVCIKEGIESTAPPVLASGSDIPQ